MNSLRHNPPRSRRHLHRKSYAEFSSESDLEFDDSTSQLSRRRRSVRARDTSSSRQTFSTSGDKSPIQYSVSSSKASQTGVVERPTCDEVDDRTSAVTRSTRQYTKAFSGYKRRKVTHNCLEPNHVKIVPTTSTARIPPWQTLPYQIWLEIMQHAACPFYHGASRDTGTMRWLLNVSELCSTFHDACIGALAATPPLFPAARAHWLIGLLKASARRDEPQEQPSKPQTSLDYRRKVKRLDIEVKQLLVVKHGIELSELLQHTPLLEDLRLYHNHDQLAVSTIWSLPDFSKLRWHYGNLFEALDQHQIKLKNFEWNGRFLRDDETFSLLLSAHERSCLQNLEAVSILNLNVQNVDKETDAIKVARRNILQALSRLKRLRSLTIRSCNIIDSPTFADLPSELASLAVISCPYLTGEGISEYLAKSGATMRRIQLLGNQAMDLGFLHNLSAVCPYLVDLEIDLNFHDPSSFKDTEPLFDELLPHGPPTWSSTLQSISIEPLRALNYKDAEAFYTSLITAAPKLTYLRVRKLKTLLNDISWRDRAQMRTKWQNLFDEIFNVKNNPIITGPKRVKSLPLSPSKPKDNKRKSARIRTKSVTTASPQQTSDNTVYIREDGMRYERQGRCHTMTFELSDQRPAQDQFKEQDFLDDEPDDDKEWTGRDEVIVPKYNAKKYGW